MLKSTNDRIDCANGIHLTVIDYPDAESLAKYLNDPAIYATTGSIPYPYSLKDAKAFISAVLKFEGENQIQRDWAIRNADGELIGGIGFLFNHGITSHKSEIGYWLGKPFWNQGIGSNVLKTWSDEMLRTRPLIRLEALVFDHNLSSCKVLENAGFAKEGYLLKACKKGDEFKNVYLYGKIDEK